MLNVQNAQELHMHFSQSIPGPAEMAEGAETYLKRHKESKYAGHLARQERECRRRKFLVEQHSRQSLEEDKHMENSIMRKLMRESLAVTATSSAGVSRARTRWSPATARRSSVSL